jgi:hypothetical protein
MSATDGAVWSSTQVNFGAVADIAKAFNIFAISLVPPQRGSFNPGHTNHLAEWPKAA